VPLTASAIAVMISGPLNQKAGDILGLGSAAVTAWNIAILAGTELNAELERGRAIAAGHPADAEPYVQPRDTRKFDDDRADNDLDDTR
jgi:membrane protein